MSINHEIVKGIMKELAAVYPEYITEGALMKKIGRPNARDELLYCKEKAWIEDRPSSQQFGNAWRATAKGVDASEIMEVKNIPCTEIPG